MRAGLLGRIGAEESARGTLEHMFDELEFEYSRLREKVRELREYL